MYDGVCGNVLNRCGRKRREGSIVVHARDTDEWEGGRAMIKAGTLLGNRRGGDDETGTLLGCSILRDKCPHTPSHSAASLSLPLSLSLKEDSLTSHLQSAIDNRNISFRLATPSKPPKT